MVLGFSKRTVALRTEHNVACVVTNQKQPIEWQVTKTRDIATEHIAAQLITDVRVL